MIFSYRGRPGNLAGPRAHRQPCSSLCSGPAPALRPLPHPSLSRASSHITDPQPFLQPASLQPPTPPNSPQIQTCSTHAHLACSTWVVCVCGFKNSVTLQKSASLQQGFGGTRGVVEGAGLALLS
uniref:Uncharacterized protein n=1 Tax=Myotis myotis TaxID=51298 RepID=A0A7J7SC76_MYOMY|nr:hypothetical protein mMyoMyo1_009515 [Myotis myotis]